MGTCTGTGAVVVSELDCPVRGWMAEIVMFNNTLVHIKLSLIFNFT